MLLSSPDGQHPLYLEVKARERYDADVEADEGHARVECIEGVMVAGVDSPVIHLNSTILPEEWSVVEVASAQDHTVHFETALHGARDVPLDLRDTGHLRYISGQ